MCLIMLNIIMQYYRCTLLLCVFQMPISWLFNQFLCHNHLLELSLYNILIFGNSYKVYIKRDISRLKGSYIIPVSRISLRYFQQMVITKEFVDIKGKISENVNCTHLLSENWLWRTLTILKWVLNIVIFQKLSPYCGIKSCNRVRN